jgi:Na+-transporting methylmalonyl-CoA/oxaloacetate decarboxylase gamma subunit
MHNRFAALYARPVFQRVEVSILSVSLAPTLNDMNKRAPILLMPFVVVIFVFMFILLLAVYLVSLGNIDFLMEPEVNRPKKKTNGQDQQPLSLSQRKQQVEYQHLELQLAIAHHEKLQTFLRKRVGLMYFYVRLGLLALWLGGNFVLYYRYGWDMDRIMNYNSLALLAVAVYIFLFHRNLDELKEMTRFLRNKVENRVYGEFISDEKLQAKINEWQAQKLKLETEIKAMEQELDKGRPGGGGLAHTHTTSLRMPIAIGKGSARARYKH